MEKIKLRWETIALAIILIVALGLRLYRIDGYLTFLGDEGRDVRIVRDLLASNLVFIGPMTSIGNMYLGPLYYYLIAPALFLSSGSPVGPAVMIALLMTATVGLTWSLARSWFGKFPALVAALLFALSPVAIIYSRSSWNPNPMPFFALISIWAIYEVWQKKKFAYLSLAAFSLAAALQMHYLGLLLIPVLGIYWFFTLRTTGSDPVGRINFIRHTLLAIGVFALMMSPLLFFDLKHNFMNANAFKSFFADRQTTINLNPARSDRFSLIFDRVISDMVLGRVATYPLIVGLVLLIGFVLAFRQAKNKNPFYVLATWLFFGFLGLIVYKQHVYAHYYGFMYPAIYLFTGISISYFLTRRLPLALFGAAFLFWLVYLNIVNSPVRQEPNRQLARTEAVVDLIIKESTGKPFNFGLIAKQNYDESYRYFLENKKAPMIRGEDKVTDQLFVICEDGEKCQPEGSPVYQVAIFGIAKTVGEWRVDSIRVYRLIHKI
ncbi:MAG: glycosyltransferase family 39 protein [Patescibacteria group bacterium]